MSYADLLRVAGDGCKETVETAYRRRRQQIRELIRYLTGLKLGNRREAGSEQFSVPIRVVEGLPAQLQSLEVEKPLSDEESAIEQIGVWGRDLSALGPYKVHCKWIDDFDHTTEVLRAGLLALRTWQGQPNLNAFNECLAGFAQHLRREPRKKGTPQKGEGFSRC